MLCCSSRMCCEDHCLATIRHSRMAGPFAVDENGSSLPGVLQPHWRRGNRPRCSGVTFCQTFARMLPCTNLRHSVISRLCTQHVIAGYKSLMSCRLCLCGRRSSASRQHSLRRRHSALGPLRPRAAAGLPRAGRQRSATRQDHLNRVFSRRSAL